MGDVIELNTGSAIPADGVFLNGMFLLFENPALSPRLQKSFPSGNNLQADESSMTGE